MYESSCIPIYWLRKNTMKIIAFGASNSRASINKQLVTHASQLMQSEILPDAEIEILDLNDYEMPIFSADRQKENGIPELAHRFFGKIGSADALLISYAEHNGNYTAAFKNIFDWASRIQMKVFQDKPAVVMSASPGANGGANVLKSAINSAPFFGADVKASLSVGSFAKVFDGELGRLTNPELVKELRRCLRALL